MCQMIGFLAKPAFNLLIILKGIHVNMNSGIPVSLVMKLSSLAQVPFRCTVGWCHYAGEGRYKIERGLSLDEKEGWAGEKFIEEKETNARERSSQENMELEVKTPLCTFTGCYEYS